MQLNKKQILEYQKNKPPYLMIDEVTDLVPGNFANGLKILNEDEWFFKVHWENDPNMPGMLQLEALTQLSALSIFCINGNKGKTMLLLNIDKARFIKKVLPGFDLILQTKVLKTARGISTFSGSAFQNGQKACYAEYKMLLSSELKQITKPK